MQSAKHQTPSDTPTRCWCPTCSADRLISCITYLLVAFILCVALSSILGCAIPLGKDARYGMLLLDATYIPPNQDIPPSHR